ncbi:MULTISPECIES: type II toxin-antitoxin system HicB family antitoxin [Clostridium]|uniref:Type II toxin-antitoxin system HicB family antitoxin n=1 Tax=Clostridium lapidicellarium TaxID=3240931 RepID=A0ABV4E1P3_9CLOT
MTQYKNNIGITFPDLPGCVSDANSMEEAVKNAREALALHLFGMEEDGFEIPKPSPINKLKLEENDIPLLVDVYMPLYREAIQNTSVRTTVTMPQWLKTLAEKNNINFSQVIQTALKEKLNINS